MTDTCNTAQKICRILVDMIAGTYELDCMNYLRKVWFGNMEKVLSTYLTTVLCADLDEIGPKLGVTMSIRLSPMHLTRSFTFHQTTPKDMASSFLNGYASTTWASYSCMLNAPQARNKTFAQKEVLQFTRTIHTTMSSWIVLFVKEGSQSMKVQAFC